MMQNKAYSVLRFPDFRFFLGTQLLYTIAVLMQEVVLGYHLYEITGDPLVLGLIGLCEVVPYLVLALYGGHIADLFDKRKIALICIGSMTIISTALLFFIPKINSTTSLTYFIYFIVFLIGVCRGFMGPAWSSIKAFLVDREYYPNAASLSSQVWQIGMISGPVAAGFLYAYIGLHSTLLIVIILFTLAFMSVFMIKTKSKVAQKEKQNIIRSVIEGYRFVICSKILIYAIALDMFSVLFGGVIAILPVFAKDILHVGPEGLGILRAAPGVGAVLTMIGTTFYSPTKKAWRNMLLAVTGFGIATFIFAFSKSFPLSVFALFLTGAFDSISVVVRQTILQLLPPDEMRGRVSSINGVFVSCSNELGAFESGVAAKLLGTVNSVIFGASLTLICISIIYYKTKDLLHIDLMKMKSES
jgi:MFS family permease